MITTCSSSSVSINLAHSIVKIFEDFSEKQGNTTVRDWRLPTTVLKNVRLQRICEESVLEKMNFQLALLVIFHQIVSLRHSSTTKAQLWWKENNALSHP